MSGDHTTLNALLREDFTSFCIKVFNTIDGSQIYQHNWHVDLISDRLKRAADREIRRLIITLPPRSLKSVCASVALPAFALGHNPNLRVICASYSSELACKFSRDCRAVMESDWYKSAFPRTRISRKKSKEDEFETTAGGYRFATSVGGTLTGRGANLIIVDDPIKPQDALSKVRRESMHGWYDGTLYSRLDNKRDDVIIIITQRTHVDDLVAHVREKEDWEHLNLPAIAEVPERHVLVDGREFTRSPGELLHGEREPELVLQQVKATLGTFFYQSQYQQAPVPEEGNLIQTSWFRYYDTLPARGNGARIIQSWDTAMKAEEIHDFSVCSSWLQNDEEFYLLDVTRQRVNYPALRELIIDLHKQFSADTVIIEDKGSGTSLIQDHKTSKALFPIAYEPKGEKAMRMHIQAAKIEAGRVYLPEDAPWLGDFLAEMLAFPQGKHDDQVDSVSQFLDWSAKRPIFEYSFN